MSKPVNQALCQALRNQPDKLIIGTNYAARVYIMSERNQRQRVRILQQLKTKNDKLSREDLAFLYTVTAHDNNSLIKNSLYTSYKLQSDTQAWKKIEAFFSELGLKEVPDCSRAWEA